MFKKDVVLVTGSTRGIGKAIAKAFAQKRATVIINGVNVENVDKTVDEFSSMGFNVYGSVFDTSDREAVFSSIKEIEEKIGDVTVLVNNAGISPKKNNRIIPFNELDYETWNRVMDVNVNGVFNCCQAVINRMIQKKSGKIINISSAFARYYSPAASCYYLTSKTAVLGLTRSISGETSKFGINCNAIAPGRAWTEMTKVQPAEVNEKFMQTIPSGKFAEVEDIANAAVFLASKEAEYMHGATLDINGGICMI